MDQNEEYHDPDYPGTSVCVKEEPPSLTEAEKLEKIKKIIRREFSNELEIRENEIMLIDQRVTSSRRLLHRLRYSLVNSYYKEQKLQLANSQIQDDIAAQHEPRARAETSSLLRDGQRRLHPSVRKLLGKQTVDIDEIFRSRAPRNKTRKDYYAMLQKRNYTIGADATKSLRPDKKEDLEVKQQACTSKPRKVPRHLEPKVTANVVKVDEVTRNKMKHRYRIVIGNTSKYAPPASRADRSTHKWLLYIRGPPHAPDLTPLLTAVTVRLHHSYAPHHTVHIDKPPYHISRRGWGEFPAKIELHFVLPDMNRPATVEHTIKLDRNYTGMQMLGAETLVDVWLYSTQEMVKYEFKDDEPATLSTGPDEQTNIQTEKQVKEEPQEMDYSTSEVENCDSHPDHWLDFFSKPTELDVDQMIIRPQKKTEVKNDLEAMIDKSVIEKSPEINTEEVIIKTEVEWTENKPVEPMDIPNEILNQPTSLKKRIVKYIDPTTGKIYYLEMDRALDLSKVQEIVINNTKTAKISPIKANGLKNVRKKKGVSLLKPELKSLLKPENCAVKIERTNVNLSHIENDHCYLATPWSKMQCSDTVLSEFDSGVVKKEKSLYGSLCSVVGRFTCLRAAVNHMVKKIPLVTDQARDPDFVKHFPFVVENEEKYWKLDFAKRRNIEWSRAKLMNKILTEFYSSTEQIWRTKQILLYCRLHGHYPLRPETTLRPTENNEWSSWNDLENTRKLESNIKEIYPIASDINTLTTFNMNIDNLSDSIDLSDDEEVDVISDNRVVVKKHNVVKECGNLTVLPVDCEQNRMMYMFIERKCTDIGIELRNEDIGNGYSYSAVHAVLLSAMKSFAEEMIRSALAAKLTMERSAHPLPTVWTGSSSSRAAVCLEHVVGALHNPRLHLVANRSRGVHKRNTYAI